MIIYIASNIHLVYHCNSKVCVCEAHYKVYVIIYIDHDLNFIVVNIYLYILL